MLGQLKYKLIKVLVSAIQRIDYCTVDKYYQKRLSLHGIVVSIRSNGMVSCYIVTCRLYSFELNG